MEAIDAAESGWGVASLPMTGEVESGDSYVIKPSGSGALIAVIDALGHGGEAAHAARVATAALGRYANEALDSLFRHCNALLRDTRGAAVSIALVDARHWTLTWLGVGNVTGALVRANPIAIRRVDRMMVRGGVVGSQLPELTTEVVDVVPGDTLILATDGVSSDFTQSLPETFSPQPLAEQILQGYATRKDDALVLVYPLAAAAGNANNPVIPNGQ